MNQQKYNIVNKETGEVVERNLDMVDAFDALYDYNKAQRKNGLPEIYEVQ